MQTSLMVKLNSIPFNIGKNLPLVSHNICLSRMRHRNVTLFAVTLRRQQLATQCTFHLALKGRQFHFETLLM